jgi:hypothetical protein
MQATGTHNSRQGERDVSLITDCPDTLGQWLIVTYTGDGVSYAYHCTTLSWSKRTYHVHCPRTIGTIKSVFIF